MGDELTQKSRYALGRVAADVAVVLAAFASTSLIAGAASSSVEATRLALSGGIFEGLTLENEIHILRRDEPAEFASAVVELLSDRDPNEQVGIRREELGQVELHVAERHGCFGGSLPRVDSPSLSGPDQRLIASPSHTRVRADHERGE